CAGGPRQPSGGRLGRATGGARAGAGGRAAKPRRREAVPDPARARTARPAPAGVRRRLRSAGRRTRGVRLLAWRGRGARGRDRTPRLCGRRGTGAAGPGGRTLARDSRRERHRAVRPGEPRAPRRRLARDVAGAARLTGARRPSRALRRLAPVLTPGAEELGELLSHLRREILPHEAAGPPDRLTHLRQVFRAVRAAGEMALEAAALATREGSLQVVADQLDHLLAHDRVSAEKHGQLSPSAASSAWRSWLR